MDLFYKDKVNAGTLVVVKLPEIRGQANLLVFNDPAPSGTTFIPGVVITNISYAQQTNTQIQQSLDNLVYIYSFGDKVADLSISGLAFPRTCKSDENGIKSILQFYKDYRISKAVRPISLTFADEVIRGYLVGMNLQTTDAAAGIHSFVLMLKTMPTSQRDIQASSEVTE